MTSNWTTKGGQSFDPCYVLYSYLHGMIPYGPARSISLFSGLPGGQIAYGGGTVTPFGRASTLSNQPTWYTDHARAIALCPRVDNYGYEADDFGGIHALGTAPAMGTYPYWGWDVVRGMVLLPDCHTGYVLDLYGGVHPIAAAGYAAPPTPKISAYWSGWDIARSIDYVGVINGADSGYVLDGWGGLHPWGNAPVASGYPYWKGWDIARAVVPYNAAGIGAGYVLDGYGGVHAFGGAPAVLSQTTYWGIDVARSLRIWDGATTGYYIDSSGSLQNFYVSPPPPSCPRCL